MGLMRGWNGKVKDLRSKSDGRFEGPFEHIKCADLYRPALRLDPPHTSLPNLAKSISVWTGWPMFDPRVCQFESDQWMDGFGTSANDSSDIEDHYRRLLEEAEEGLATIAAWNASNS